MTPYFHPRAGGFRRVQHGDDFAVEGNARFSAVLGRDRADQNVRAFVIELEIAPDNLAQFAKPQAAGVGGCQIEETMLARNAEEFVGSKNRAQSCREECFGEVGAAVRIGGKPCLCRRNVPRRAGFRFSD